MLHILIHLIIATFLILLPTLSQAQRSLSEIAAGLSIDDTLEMEGQQPPDDHFVPIKQPVKPKTPALRPKPRTPGTATATPSRRLPLYPYRSFGNNYQPVAQPANGTVPSPAELAVTKDYQEIKALEPMAGEMQGPPMPPPPEPDEKEKAMRKTIETVEKTHSGKPDAATTKIPSPTTQTIPAQVKRIGSVPGKEKEADYVSILEKSLLLDPQALPLKFPFYDESGNEVTLKQFKGKLIVLNFWATWCTPCAMEMPSLDALQEAYTDKGLPVKVVAVSEDFKGIDTIRQFYKQNTITQLDIYHDKGNTLFRELGIISLPTTLLIDQEGNEILRMSGYIDWHKPEVQDFVRGFVK